MDQIEDSAEESNAAGEQYEEEIVPKIINDEVFEEVTTRANTIVRDLQNSKQYLVAEDLQKLLLVCQNLRQNVIDEKDKIEQMKAEVTAAQARVQHAVKMSKQDQEVIQQLKSEIGMKTDTQFLFDSKLRANLFLSSPSFHPAFEQCAPVKIKHGIMRTRRPFESKYRKKPKWCCVRSWRSFKRKRKSIPVLILRKSK